MGVTKMKKIISIILMLCLISSYGISYAYYEDDITVMLNDEELYFDQEPVMINDRVLVPMRFIFEAMDCDVDWDEDVMQIDVYKNDDNIMTLWIDDNEMYLPDDVVYLDVPPQLINDRTLVPIRAISESIGADVDWDDSTNTVIITYYPDDDDDYDDNYGNDDDDDDEQECTHENTYYACAIDEREFENTGSATQHKVIDKINEYCYNCGQKVGSQYDTSYSTHTFKNDVCTACGYKKGTCRHLNIREVCSIDERKFENTGSATQHKVIDKINEYCNDCHEKVNTRYNTSYYSHDFEDSVCTDCGYTKETATPKPTATPNPTSSEFVLIKNLSPVSQYYDAKTSSVSSSGKQGLRLYIDQTRSKNSSLSVGDNTTASVEYNVSEFNSFSGKVNGDYRPSVLKVYGDGELIFETIKMKGSSNIDMDLDISQYNTLKLEAIGTVTIGLSHTSVTILDAKLWY